MRKVLSVVLVLCIISAGVVLAAPGVRVLVNGQQTDIALKLVNGVSFVPLRALANLFDIPVHWNESARAIELGSARWPRLEADLADREATVRTLEAQIAAQADRIQTLERDLAAGISDKQRLVQQLEAAVAERQTAIRALEAQIAAQAGRIQTLERDLVAAIASTEGAVRNKTVAQAVDPYSPIIDLAALGISPTGVEALQLEKYGTPVPLSVVVNISGTEAHISIHESVPRRDGVVDGMQTNFIGFASGSPVLELNQQYLLRAYTKVGQRYRISFRTGGLPALANESFVRQVILIPAMPEKGFHWPYLLLIPNREHMAANLAHRRHLLIDTINVGTSFSLDETIVRGKDFITHLGYPSLAAAHELWSPVLMPLFLRPFIALPSQEDGEWNTLYTTGLDRDSARLHLNLQDPNRRQDILARFAAHNLDAKDFVRPDLQLIAMIDHALAYLNPQGFNLERKVFLHGFSASGTFTDRFTALHPERVRALASGATLDDMILPLAEYRGEKLIFPIGVYDFAEITGRPFSLPRHNQVARLIYMGEADPANALPYNDSYGSRERQIITDLWGVEVLPRARQLIELYGKSGGEGMFILDRGIGHASSPAMQQYIVQFLRANRDGDTPVYFLPTNSEQLMYTLFGTATAAPSPIVPPPAPLPIIRPPQPNEQWWFFMPETPWPVMEQMLRRFAFSSFSGSMADVVRQVKDPAWQTQTRNSHTLLIINPTTVAPALLSTWPKDQDYFLPLSLAQIEQEAAQPQPFLFLRHCLHAHGRVRAILVVRNDDELSRGLQHLITNNPPLNTIIRF